MRYIGIRLNCADNTNWQDNDQKREFEAKRQELVKRLKDLGINKIDARTGISVFAEITEEQLDTIQTWKDVSWYFSETTYRPA